MKRGRVLVSLSSVLALPFAAAQANPYASLTPEQLEIIAQSNPDAAAQIAQINAGGTAYGAGLGGLAGLAGALIFVAIAIGLAAYIYVALALRAIAKKLKIENDWLAFIPIANFWIVKEAAQAPMWSFYASIAAAVLMFIPGVSFLGGLGLAGIFAWWGMTMCPRLGRPQWWAYILAIPFLQPVITMISLSLSSIVGLASIASAVLLGVLAWGESPVTANSMPAATAELAKPSTPAPAPIVGVPATA